MAIPQYYANPPHFFVFLLCIIIIISLVSGECKLRNDNSSIAIASSDYGNMEHETPAFVLYPSSDADIIDLVKSTSRPSTVAARGHGHSVRGQALTSGGVVVNMTALGENKGDRIVIGGNLSCGFYADIGAEQLWVDVLRATLRQGLAPVSWTDYLYLSVGGTLSNAGISGRASLRGPQIANVLQLQVITGKGENLTCSPNENPELFLAVLGGLGQFGIITRARIVLDKAPTNVKWAKLVYSNFSTFINDQEHLISGSDANYVEGYVIVNVSVIDQWKPALSISQSDRTRIVDLLTNHSLLFAIELAVFYDNQTDSNTIDQKFETLLKELNFIPGLNFNTDVLFFDFLHRLGNLDTLQIGSQLSHPYLALFIPKSDIVEFNKLVVTGMLPRLNQTSGNFMFFPLKKNKWNDSMSAVTPEGDIFYGLGLLHSIPKNAYKSIDAFNNEILRVCEESDIKIKQYLPHYTTQEDWINHFGQAKWETFVKRKELFDPNMILSPGQKIFN
ncbi:Cytokinin dehydrogenase 4 [Striga hermonthica]|uniref:cytokinin dehydrogenase n=1 Tax=Striga hermonthica TaxID=68872 RepID=A0A9N7MT21_STRHE|nr:Cytokinin dehydrogenase 4 [Striga hermonthica]